MTAVATPPQAQVRALGVGFDADILHATRAIYRPLLDTTPVREHHELRYGGHARQVLDLFLPVDVTRPSRALLVFVHGGGFTGGAKNEDGAFHLNVGRFFARHGLATAVINYRLAPASPWPAAVHDVRDAVGWLREGNADAQLGAQAASLPLFVLGQSAGACHTASWLFDDRTRGEPLGAVAGVMLMSGYYRATAPMAPHVRAYFGDREDQYETRSPLTHVRALDTPVWLSVAELDPGAIAARTFELAARLALCNGAAPHCVWFAGHNHVSTVSSLGSSQSDAGEALLQFVHARLNTRRPTP
ncbi:alpha/beta hydrolase [Hydrogenophaga sp.]|uniref:alpha/beta hydrolase n=1 Tax=Hydrogenophaga sp. TaxID=1904254 RepID=UPI002718C4EE|nr:alpha/beta hydrolase [Hydrogenophaga sp.]MDO9436547.1 alpha/beta hydrolase [Hydrogenophaga sp.]